MITKRLASIALFFVLPGVILTSKLATSEHPARRPVTMADAIRMRRLPDAGGAIAHFSPDRRNCVVVTRRGLIEENVNEYSLLLWKTNQIFGGKVPDELVKLSSSSNRPAIQQVSWINDETLAFLGEHEHESQQLYTFNLKTKTLTKITDHPTNLISYSMSSNDGATAYIAEEPPESIFDLKARREGFIVSTQWLPQLLRGVKGPFEYRNQLWYQQRSRAARQLRTVGRIGPFASNSNLALSPDRRYVVLTTFVEQIPELWMQYTDRDTHQYAVSEPAEGQFSLLQRYELIDTSTGQSELLMNSPVGVQGSEAAWSPDSQSVVFTDMFLPLQGASSEELDVRRAKPFTIEINVRSREMLKVGPSDLKLVEWDRRTNTVLFANRKPFQLPDFGNIKRYRKREGRWEEVSGPLNEAGPEVIDPEDMNTPPRIVAVDSKTQQRTLLLDLNPDFKGLSFARVEQVSWKDADGVEMKGGLYYPPNYVHGRKYPLVIQTHWWRPDLFWIDGPWTTAFAAQPLAGRDMMVLQMDESWLDTDTPKEVDRNVALIESAIDYLDGRGLVERTRVGLIGFSRTCLFVTYALSHSKYTFAAASVSDGVDAGYFQYIAYANVGLGFAGDQFNGGAPFGPGLVEWMKRSPGFNIDKVHTPLRIIAEDNSWALLNGWEWFSALYQLHKPVEMVLMKDGSHILERPWQRLISQQGNVDWFDFWLNGNEDPDPRKKEQYARWRKLKQLDDSKEN